jgi:hypothetical protein
VTIRFYGPFCTGLGAMESMTAVSLAAVPDILDPDLMLCLVDGVEHPVIASPGPEDTWQANERFHVCWPWILRELID